MVGAGLVLAEIIDIPFPVIIVAFTLALLGTFAVIVTTPLVLYLFRFAIFIMA